MAGRGKAGLDIASAHPYDPVRWLLFFV